jgi:hypothetical protein
MKNISTKNESAILSTSGQKMTLCLFWGMSVVHVLPEVIAKRLCTYSVLVVVLVSRGRKEWLNKKDMVGFVNFLLSIKVAAGLQASTAGKGKVTGLGLLLEIARVRFRAPRAPQVRQSKLAGSPTSLPSPTWVSLKRS